MSPRWSGRPSVVRFWEGIICPEIQVLGLGILRQLPFLGVHIGVLVQPDQRRAIVPLSSGATRTQPTAGRLHRLSRGIDRAWCGRADGLRLGGGVDGKEGRSSMEALRDACHRR